jgi:hypothetical protein
LRTVKTSQLNNPPTNALPTVTKGTSLSPSSSPVSAKKINFYSHCQAIAFINRC